LFISKIQLKNYRNYEKLELSFEDKVNVIIGENAQGKTNLMEAIYVLAMAKSHRTSNDRELIRWDEDFGQIKGKLQKRNSSLSLELNISKKGKKAKLNQLEQKPFISISIRRFDNSLINVYVSEQARVFQLKRSIKEKFSNKKITFCKNIAARLKIGFARFTVWLLD